MSLIILDQLSLSYGAQPLLDQVSLTIEAGERLCLVGRNGAGKSSLLKVLANQIQPDDGNVQYRSELKIGYLDQTLPGQSDITVRELVSSARPEIEQLMQNYHEESGKADLNIEKLQSLQHQIEDLDGWNHQQQVERVISRLELDPEIKLKQLSGGWRRRALLAKALLEEPQVLLLDEPTNHLDIDAILWLEQFLKDYPGTLIFISHDRRFIDHLATRIIELDRGHLSSFPGNYQNYLDKKAELLDQESNQNREFDKKLAQEEVWIRQGIKARRTRNEGRARALQALREERKARREKQKSADFTLEQGQRSGKIVFEVEQLNYSIGGKCLVKDFSTIVERGDRVALLGANGIGKSTLIRLLLGEIEPDSGQIKTGTNLEAAYFDQAREQLDLEATVLDTVGQGNDQIVQNGKSRHIYSYLQDFLFTPERVRTPIKALSGGERNRVLLARLFTKPCNLLVMDEPTNDLDMETLELLEDLLSSFEGTLLLVSHDRQFVDAVATQSWVFEGEGVITEWVGGYEDWQRMSGQSGLKAKQSDQPKPEKSQTKKPEKSSQRPAKLSYKIKLEYEKLPAEIEALETQLAELQQQVSDEGFYQQGQEVVVPVLEQIQTLQDQLDQKMERWLEIELMLEQ